MGHINKINWLSGPKKNIGSSYSLAANCIFWDNHSNGDTSIKFGMHNLLRSSIQKKTLVIPKSKMAAIFQDGCQYDLNLIFCS